MIIDSIDALHAYAERSRTPDCKCPTCAPFHFIVELLETPAPCGWPKPELVLMPSTRGDGAAVAWDSIAGFMTPDEAIAIGVALVRAGFQGKAG